MYTSPFKSFWMAGYECTDKLNAFGKRVDFLNLTWHLQFINEDYEHLKEFNIQSVREGIRWSQVEKKPYEYDWNVVEYMISCGRKHGIQQIWDICHFGFPDDLTPLHPMFANRFAAICRAFVLFYRSILPDEPLIVTPINEVSFLSWLGGEVKGTTPYCTNQGWEVKYNLMRAYIEGATAIKEIDSNVVILSTEPLVNMVPPILPAEQDVVDARFAHESQFQAVEILTGRLYPELGGRPELLDIIGLNFYFNNQWINKTSECLPWHNNPPDPRWIPLRSLLSDVFYRYNLPIALTETSHPGIDRPDWLKFVTTECAAVLREKIPFWGICLYPIIDRPDWDHLHPWHASGLWDAKLDKGYPQRVLYQPYAQALVACQDIISSAIT